MNALSKSRSESPEPAPSRKDLRQQSRHEPDLPRARVTLQDGSSHDCDVIDVSLGGASLRTNAPGRLGDVATLGKMRGPIIRIHEGGFVIQFTDV